MERPSLICVLAASHRHGSLTSIVRIIFSPISHRSTFFTPPSPWRSRHGKTQKTKKQVKDFSYFGDPNDKSRRIPVQ
jgi:hypothetical protein